MKLKKIQETINEIDFQIHYNLRCHDDEYIEFAKVQLKKMKKKLKKYL